MWLELLELGIMGGGYIYHRWISPTPNPPSASEIDLPRNDAGAPYPLLYGRCRVRAPIVGWTGTPSAEYTDPGDSPSPDAFPGRYLYFFDMFLVLGIPIAEGSPKLFSVYVGDVPMLNFVGTWLGHPFVALSELTGDGGFEDSVRPTALRMYTGETVIRGSLEFLNGNAAQVVPENTAASVYMIDYGGLDATLIPSYRGYLSCLLYGLVSDHVAHPSWVIGTDPNLQQYGFEVGSYPVVVPSSSPFFPINSKIGDDINPIAALYDILTGVKKLGLATTRIHEPSFIAAAQTLKDEVHGFSRSWEQSAVASDLVGEVLRQIDGVIYEDPADGLIHSKLIRADYVINEIAVIDPSNCVEIQNFAAGGWTDVPNKVTITFSNRQANYVDGSAVAQNQANAVGQDGEVREVVLQMPGVCTQALADELAARELAYRSRPLMKCRAIVDRSFLRTMPGDPVMLNWPEANISGIVFRVAAVGRGTLEDGKIALDLIQDGFYNHRRRPPLSDALAPFPGPPLG